MTLLAAAPTLEDISTAIARFYCGSPKRLEANGPNAWKLIRGDGKELEGVRVVHVRGRYRFEAC